MSPHATAKSLRILFNMDVMKSESDIKYIWLKNVLYEEELYRYNQLLEKFKQDSIPPPPPIFLPFRPAKFYKFFLIDESKNCSDSLVIKLIGKNVKMFDRNKLKNLTPYQNKIFIVHKKNDVYTCYPVSFFHNAQE